MANISDYLDWRGDLSFSADPFQEVDSLILSEAVYTDLGGIVPGPGTGESIGLAKACHAFFSKHTEEEILAQVSSTKMAPFLLQKMACSKRFSKVRMTGYVNCVEEEAQTQFAVVTFLLPDDTVYVAFRGTDNTIIGWKEDFNMSFLSHTKGQTMAADYLSQNFAGEKRPIRVGGHSKGGNFAVYASAFCQKGVQKKIIGIYSNDGPGFQQSVLKTDEYQRILPKVTSIVPEQSIVSLLFENHLRPKVVRSVNNGASQHDAMSWQVIGNQFVEAEGLSEKSLLFDQAFHTWLDNLDKKTRKVFSDAVFELLASDGASTLDDLKNSGASWEHAIKSMRNLDPEKQEIVYEVLRKLAVTSVDTLRQNLKQKPKPKPFEGLHRLLFRETPALSAPTIA